MKDILIHYGVKGMKWGVRKEYEGTGRSGGGGWGPNTVAGGGGPSPLAASVAGNPKKKKTVGKNAVEKMGVEDKKSPEEKRREGTKIDATELSKSLAELSSLNYAVGMIQMSGADVPKELVDKYQKAEDNFLKTCADMDTKFGEGSYEFDYYSSKGKDYVMSSIYDYKLDDFIWSTYEIPDIQFTEKK